MMPRKDSEHGILRLWRAPLKLEVVRSLLSLTDIQEPRPDRGSLMAIGVVEVFRSRRITVDKYRNLRMPWRQ